MRGVNLRSFSRPPTMSAGSAANETELSVPQNWRTRLRTSRSNSTSISSVAGGLSISTRLESARRSWWATETQHMWSCPPRARLQQVTGCRPSRADRRVGASYYQATRDGQGAPALSAVPQRASSIRADSDRLLRVCLGCAQGVPLARLSASEAAAELIALRRPAEHQEFMDRRRSRFPELPWDTGIVRLARLRRHARQHP
jgi:hypothetical protein